MLKKLALSALIAVSIAGVSACSEDAKAVAAQAPAPAQAPADAANKAPAKQELSFEDKVAVAVGTMYGKNLGVAVTESQKFEVKMNKDKIASSFISALNGKAEMTDEEAQAVLQEFDTQMRAKQQALSKAEAEKNLKEGEAFLAENKTKEGVVVTASGLQYKITTLGTGAKPAVTDKIRVTYKGTNLKGEVFDKSEEPVEFPLGQVIEGWKEGFQLLPVGTKATLYIPANLAYGSFSPSEKIGANSVLVFEVELLDIVKDAPKAEAKAEAKADAKADTKAENKPAK